MSRTYVLVGDDHNGAFKDDVRAWEDSARARNSDGDPNNDVVIIRAKPGQSIEEAAKEMQPPGNAVVLCHGGETGTFTWNKGESLSYKQLFDALPQGTESCTLGSCYGGSAIYHEFLEHAPAGMLLQSLVGAKVVGLSDQGIPSKEMAEHKDVTPLGQLLEALDNINPEAHAAAIARMNERNKTNYNNNLNDVLPHTIGLGGQPPTIIDLNDKMAELSAQGKNGSLDKASLKSAVDKVKEHFDPNKFDLSTKKDTTFWSAQSYDAQLKAKVDAKIDAVAEKLLDKDFDTKNFTLEEKRIAYAITAANMYSSREMQRLVDKSRSQHAEKEKELKSAMEYTLPEASKTERAAAASDKPLDKLKADLLRSAREFEKDPSKLKNFKKSVDAFNDAVKEAYNAPDANAEAINKSVAEVKEELGSQQRRLEEKSDKIKDAYNDNKRPEEKQRLREAFKPKAEQEGRLRDAIGAIGQANDTGKREHQQLKEQQEQQRQKQAAAAEQQKAEEAKQRAAAEQQKAEEAKRAAAEAKQRAALAQSAILEPTPSQAQPPQQQGKPPAASKEMAVQGRIVAAPDVTAPQNSPNTLRDAAKLLKSFDRSRDGTVTNREFQKGGGPEAIGNKLDLNGDGTTSAGEIKLALEKSGLKFDKVALNDAIKNLGSALAQSGVKVNLNDTTMPTTNPNAHLAHNAAKGNERTV